MAGQQMVMLAVRPTAVDFVETLLRGAGADLLLEDVLVAPDSPLVTATTADVRRQLLGSAVLVGVRRDNRVNSSGPG